MKKTFVKPEIQVMELRLEERIASQSFTSSDGGPPCFNGLQGAFGTSCGEPGCDGGFVGQPCPICGQYPCICPPQS